jgi:hypothetical protein
MQATLAVQGLARHGPLAPFLFIFFLRHLKTLLGRPVSVHTAWPKTLPPKQKLFEN